MNRIHIKILRAFPNYHKRAYIKPSTLDKTVKSCMWKGKHEKGLINIKDYVKSAIKGHKIE